MARKKIIGWKQLQDRLLAELEIPASARRVLNVGPERKCRAERVKVLKIEIGDPYAREWNAANGSNNEVNSGVSRFSKKLTHYKVGEVIYADMFDPSPVNQCSHGINFFLTREQASAYNSS